MLMYAGVNFAIPKTVHCLTIGPFYHICDLINRMSFGIRISKYLIWQKRGEGGYYHEYNNEQNLKKEA